MSESDSSHLGGERIHKAPMWARRLYSHLGFETDTSETE